MFDLIKTRRSTRKFKDAPVPDDLVEQVVEAGRYAPSGGNVQSTHFIVIQNPQVLQDIAEQVKQEFAKMDISEAANKSIANSITVSKTGNYVFHYGCPVLIITANKKGYGNNIADCSCALENMMLMANALDLGSVWVNQLRWLKENPVLIEAMKKLGMEEGERVYGALALGYPDTPDGKPVREITPRIGYKVDYIK